MNLLRKIGACQLNEPKLTPLGQHLAALPVNVKIGKMLIFGAIFGCLDPVVSEKNDIFKSIEIINSLQLICFLVVWYFEKMMQVKMFTLR